ncbi:MAG: DUF167 domain-containing protein [Planctomycetota bacterium]|jgi:uncharacterized protein (TIGR00251 family)
MIEMRREQGALLLPVKVVPGASRTRCLGELDGRAKIAVAAAAEGGKANRALIGFLARLLGLRQSAVTIASGRSSPLKTIRIDRVSPEDVLGALGLDRS